MNPVAQYVLSLATCVIGYFAYLKYAVPLIEQPATRNQQLAQQPARVPIPKIYKNSMIPLLPPQAWELGECKTLITSTGTILFKEFSPQPDGTVKLSPFTLMTNVGEELLLKQSSDPTVDQKVPLVLRTVEGAMLKLNKPFTEALQGGTEIQSARLLGEVDIYRPPSGPNKNDVLHVLTRNVNVDSKSIYTLDTLDKPFLFSYGPHRGRGRNLIIDLVHDHNTAAGQQGFSSISGIQRLELAYLDRLRIVPSKAKLTADNAASEPADDKLFGGEDAPLEVSCKGPCVLDFNAQTVSFFDHVLVKKISPTADSIACQRLQIKFDQNPLVVKSKKQTRLTPQPNEPKQELGIESLVADSSPNSNGSPGPPVVVNAISRPATITASRLTYQAKTDIITGTAGPSSNGMVSLVTPDLQYKTQELTCKLATGPGDKKTLDALSASGPGQLLKLGKTPAEEMLVRWTKSLNTARDPQDPSIQTLVLIGDTHVQFQQTSSIDAERIDLKLKRYEKPTDSSTDPEFAVMEIVATQDVRIATPEVSGKTDRLIAEFPNPIKLKSQQVGRPRYQTGNTLQVVKQSTAIAAPIPATFKTDNDLLRQASAPRKSYVQLATATSAQILTRPNDANDLNQAANASQAPSKHLNFSGQQVKISILEATKESFAFENLIINGEVSVSQNVPKEPNLPNSLEIKGDHLRIVPQPGDERFRLELSATTGPATIKSPEFTITGQKIHLDQVDNKLWVEGAGKFNFDHSETAPVQPRFGPANRGGFAQSQALGVIRNEPKSSSKFEATWQGGMIFDGRKIYLERDVISKTEQFDGIKHNVTQANCGQMSVALNRYVNFEQLKQKDRDGLSKPTDIEPTELIFIDKVDPLNQVFGQVPVDPNFKSLPSLILNRIYGARDKLLQQQTVSAKQVRVDPISKNIFADGAGWVSTHDLQAPGGSRSNRSTKHPLAGMAKKNSDPSKPITFIRANFADSMAIDAAKKQMTISGRVRTVYLQTDDWNTNPDPDRIPPALQAQALVLTSELLTLAQWQPRDSAEVAHELIASGNVRILGDTIDLSADRVSYNQANDMLVVNGTNRTAARIRFREDTGATKPWQEYIAEKFEYQIASQTVNVNGVQKGEAIRID